MLRTAKDFLNLVTNQRDRVLYVFNLDNLDVLRQLKFEEFIYRNISPLSPNSAFFLLNNHQKERAVIFGLSGNPSEFIKDFDYCKNEKIKLIKRFTGGGTVLIDGNAITSSFISSHSLAPGLNPKEICRWTFDNIYLPCKLFNNSFSLVDGDYVIASSGTIPTQKRTSNMDFIIHNNNSNNNNNNSNNNNNNNNNNYNSNTPTFNFDSTSFTNFTNKWDKNYIYYKVGGNAQAYSKHSFVHHTSFIWNVSPLIEKVLLIPKKIPKYRDNRAHSDFLASLSLALTDRFSDKLSFSQSLGKSVTLNTFKHLKFTLNYTSSSKFSNIDSDYTLDDFFFNSCLDSLERSNTSLLSLNSH